MEQNEIDITKKKGVKRELYIGMTASDIQNNITRNAKLNNIQKKYKIDDPSVYSTTTFILQDYPYKEDIEKTISLCKKEISEKTNKKTQIENQILLSNAKLEQIEKQIASKEPGFMESIGKGLYNAVFGQSEEDKKAEQELNYLKGQAAQIKNNIKGLLDSKNSLSRRIEYYTESLKQAENNVAIAPSKKEIEESRQKLKNIISETSKTIDDIEELATALEEYMKNHPEKVTEDPFANF